MKNTEKMQLVAEKLGELNDKGKPKGFSANSNGHAQITQLCRGCTIWFIHENDNSLRLTIEYTKAAKEGKNSAIICQDSVQKFKNIFPNCYSFTRPLFKSNPKNGFAIDVSGKNIDEIFRIIDNFKKDF